MRKPALSIAMRCLVCFVASPALSAIIAHPQTAANIPEPTCMKPSPTPGETLTACLIYGKQRASEPMNLQKLELVRKNRPPIFIAPGGVIREWHLWNEPYQLAVSFDGPDGNQIHALYDTATGDPVEKLDIAPTDPSELPQWAKSLSDLEDESVPESKELDLDRTQWISKIMHRIEAIHPGMRRKDLEADFTQEGGLSTRTQREYVLKHCPYIKIDVTFKPARNNTNSMNEDPEDVIEIVSKPYLQWSIMD